MAQGYGGAWGVEFERLRDVNCAIQIILRQRAKDLRKAVILTTNANHRDDVTSHEGKRQSVLTRVILEAISLFHCLTNNLPGSHTISPNQLIRDSDQQHSTIRFVTLNPINFPHPSSSNSNETVFASDSASASARLSSIAQTTLPVAG